MERRSLLKLATLLASVPFVSKAVARAAPPRLGLKDLSKETEIAVVYHSDFPQVERFQAMLGNIRNHLSVYDFNPFLIKAVVVAHGPGVKFFMKDLAGTPWEKESIDVAQLYQAEKDLTLYGVEYYICNITLTRLNLNPEKLHEFTTIVPSGVGAIGELQARGYAYIKVQ